MASKTAEQAVAEKWSILVVGAPTSLEGDLASQLSQVGAVVFTASMSEANRTVETIDADAVIVDLEKTGEAGLAFASAVKAARARRHVPVLALATTAQAGLELDAYAAGCDDFLVRPFPPMQLVGRARRGLQLRKRFDAVVEEAEKLYELSVTDGLTQVFNRRFFEERLVDEFRRAERYQDALSLIMCDVDHFKRVNDQHGHLAGDTVLADVAASLKRSVRATDLVARYGGEEFVVILPRTALDKALTVAERMYQEISRMKTGPNGQLRITASFGVSGYPNPTIATSQQLLWTADEALNRAKREGRNRIRLYTPAPMGLPAEGHA